MDKQVVYYYKTKEMLTFLKDHSQCSKQIRKIKHAYKKKRTKKDPKSTVTGSREEGFRDIKSPKTKNQTLSKILVSVEPNLAPIGVAPKFGSTSFRAHLFEEHFSLVHELVL